MENTKGVSGIVIALLAVQLIDIAIHVGTGQVEAIRILSNAVLGFWALASMINGAAVRYGLPAILLYLGLNGVFVYVHGITNPDQDGALRVALFLLVGVSTALAFLLRSKVGRD